MVCWHMRNEARKDLYVKPREKRHKNSNPAGFSYHEFAILRFVLLLASSLQDST